MGLCLSGVDLGADALVPAHYHYIHSSESCTTLAKEGVKVATVEHLMAACAGLGVDNALIELDQPELPILDGSAQLFVRSMLDVGLQSQEKEKSYWVIDKEYTIRDGDKYITLKPYDGLKVRCEIVYDHPLFNEDNQLCEFLYSPQRFIDDCAPARTYGFKRDYAYLLENNLARGASLENVLVLGDTEVENPEGMRFHDECVRHKILDLLGDLYLSGQSIKAEIIAHQPGHALNAKVLRACINAETC